MEQDIVIHYNTPAERIAAIEGMMNAKNEWLAYVEKREKELGLR